MKYLREESHFGIDCVITKHAHVVVIHENETDVSFCATCVTVYRGWMGVETDCNTKVFEEEKSAIEYCEKHFKI